LSHCTKDLWFILKRSSPSFKKSFGFFPNLSHDWKQDVLIICQVVDWVTTHLDIVWPFVVDASVSKDCAHKF